MQLGRQNTKSEIHWTYLQKKRKSQKLPDLPHISIKRPPPKPGSTSSYFGKPFQLAIAGNGIFSNCNRRQIKIGLFNNEAG